MRRSIIQVAKRSRVSASSAVPAIRARHAFPSSNVSYDRHNVYPQRTFASSSSGSDKNESFRDMLKKVKASAEAGSAKKEEGADGASSSTSANPTDATGAAAGSDNSSNTTEANAADNTAKQDQETINPQEVLSSGSEKLSKAYSWLKDNVRLAWADLTGESKESTLRKKVYQAESFRKGGEKKEGEEGEEGEGSDNDEDKQERGPGTLVVVKDQGSAWDQMRARLSESPLIREMLKKTKKISSAAAETDIGKKAVETGQNIKNKVEDIREYWETSQNPLVYKISGVWDSLTAETEEGVAIKEIQKFDPNFIKEEWSQEVRFDLVPRLIRSHLIGELKEVKPWLSESVYQKLTADIRARKSDGYVFDPNVLEVDENQVIIRLLDGEGPVIVVVYMVQQINCIKNKAGEIVEGAEDQIRAKFYSIAFKQVYHEEDGHVQWTVVDYEFAGDIPYI